jgi:AP-1 complex subunit mu
LNKNPKTLLNKKTQKMGISSIYIMDQKGRVLITRAYRADVPYSANEIFQEKMLGLDEMTMKPVIIDEENQVVFMHLRHQNLICNIPIKLNQSC